tara:strand:- start:725521 stop:727539 length:2019 start_codon:yes stop_codon:yes gene_type:complete
LNYFLYYSFVLLVISFNNDGSNIIRNGPSGVENDSLLVWIKKAENKNLSYRERKINLDKAYSYSKKEVNDSLRNLYFLDISLGYYNIKDSLAFRKVNKQSLNLSIALKDSMNIGNNYWDLGRFFSNNGVKDSAFYAYSKAEKVFSLSNEDKLSGTMLLNMAIIQSDIKDYTGSDITTTQAISVLKPLNDYRMLYKCYNNLGINFNQLEEYDKAIYYHNIALEYEEKITNKSTYRENSLNNIGVVYEKQLNYQEALRYYNEALQSENLFTRNPGLYAKLLDNSAYSRLKLKDATDLESAFQKSLEIRESINDYLGVAVNKLHLAEYYIVKKDTAKAIAYALESKKLAQSTDNFRDLLSVLLFLSNVDTKNGVKYTNEYIQLSDSLYKQERATRDKFTRIRFETDEFIVENKRLNQQKNLIIIISSLMGALGLLLFVIRNQRTKNRELKFEQEQQMANEEIYNLMISQQNKLDEGSRNEKRRISEELHDGVLGKLFGTRLILGSLNAKNDPETILKREKYIDELKDIEEEVRNVSHELNADFQSLNVGYLNMIENLLDERSEISKFTYKLNHDKSINWKAIDGTLKMNLYRIIQESVQNINKYANATNVVIEFAQDENYLYLSIEDDGVGFDQDRENEGIGLSNMKSRVNKIDGELSIKSEVNKGTLIHIKVAI